MSSVSPVSSSTQANDTDVSSRVPVQTLGQDDFLKLLVTQMTSQDPLNPTSDTDFIAQMAQFSALEQTKNLTTDVASLNSQQQFSSASGLLGRTVQVQTSDNTIAQGVVSAVQMDSGTPKLIVDGQAYDLSQILSVTPTSNN